MRSPRPVVTVHLCWAGLVSTIVAGLLLAAASTTQPEGQCEGLGFGCTISGADLAAFVAIFIVPIALAVLVIGHLVITIVHLAIVRISEDREAHLKDGAGA
jgi:hypothetical protein